MKGAQHDPDIEAKRHKNDLYIAVCLGAILGCGLTTIAMLFWVLVLA